MNDEALEPLLYRQLMAIKPKGLTANKWLVEAGVNRSFFADLRRRGRARNDIVNKLIEAAGLTPAQFYGMTAPEVAPEARAEEVRSQSLPFRSDVERRDVPIVGTALGADLEVKEDGHIAFAEVTDLDLGDVHDYARRPLALENRRDVYVLTVVGSSMAEKFEPGDPAYVDPRTTPRIGDDVVVYLRRPEDDGEQVYSVLLKRLVKRNSQFIELQQFNPRVTFTLAMKDVAKIHRVIPWRELTVF